MKYLGAALTVVFVAGCGPTSVEDEIADRVRQMKAEEHQREVDAAARKIIAEEKWAAAEAERAARFRSDWQAERDRVQARRMRVEKATINAAVERYYINENGWPANDLSDIGGDVNYFPDGIPTNPTDGSAYTLNATTHRVN